MKLIAKIAKESTANSEFLDEMNERRIKLQIIIIEDAKWVLQCAQIVSKLLIVIQWMFISCLIIKNIILPIIQSVTSQVRTNYS